MAATKLAMRILEVLRAKVRSTMLVTPLLAVLGIALEDTGKTWSHLREGDRLPGYRPRSSALRILPRLTTAISDRTWSSSSPAFHDLKEQMGLVALLHGEVAHLSMINRLRPSTLRRMTIPRPKRIRP